MHFVFLKHYLIWRRAMKLKSNFSQTMQCMGLKYPKLWRSIKIVVIKYEKNLSRKTYQNWMHFLCSKHSLIWRRAMKLKINFSQMMQCMGLKYLKLWRSIQIAIIKYQKNLISNTNQNWMNFLCSKHSLIWRRAMKMKK